MSGLPDITAPVRYEATELLELLRVLRLSPRDTAFWPRLCVAINALGRGRSAMLLSRQGERWQPLALCAPPDGMLEMQVAQLLPQLIGRAARHGHATLAQGDDAIVACVRLLGDEGELYALVEIPARERASLNELLLRLQLIADLPLSRQEPTDAGTAGTAAPGTAGAVDAHLLELLDLAARVMQEQAFGPAALALVNGLVPLTGCDQVVLGWKEVSYVRAKAISHLDRFERKAENVQLIEAALEEALDQQTDIVYPAPPAYGGVVLAHERLGRAINHTHMRSLVLHRADESPEAVVLLAAQTDRFAPELMHQVSVAMHLMLPWLADLHQRDRWFGARWWQRVHHQAGQWFGPDKPVRTLGIGLASLLLLFVLVGTWPHRIEANAELVTDSTQLVSAPFDGFVQEVGVSLGDEVQANALLGRLDVRDLLLQESEIGADLRRYIAEADRARAQGELAEVEIAQARVAQAQARLDKVLFYLQQAQIKAPFAAVVVEGDRRDLAGMPVRQGDRLFRLARVEGLYAALHMPERDVRHLQPNAVGELRLLSEPNRSIGFRVQSTVPVAQVKGQQGNHFWVRVQLTDPPEDWWRPGMSGMAQVDAGRKNIAWLLTHRLVDLVRMKLWI
ncbi:efflux RND transporter periplasmic adaptor subunit [Hydrogenophaga sp.]|uniref:efflux RND transporter periplasmic adaptor subunit n=1 Tax=Hydrogenophaga sp. TaxID=1904254 RepID=UPI003F6A99F9